MAQETGLSGTFSSRLLEAQQGLHLSSAPPTVPSPAFLPSLQRPLDLLVVPNLLSVTASRELKLTQSSF